MQRVVQMTSVHGPYDIRIFHKECKSLAKAGYEVTLVAPQNEADHILDGIRLRTVPLPRDRRERLAKTIPAVYRRALEANADVYHFHDPELMPVGLLLRLRGKKVIYDVHEDYSSNMQKHWIPSALQGPASLAVKFSEATLGRICSRVVAATPKIAANFDSRMTSVVQNFPWLDEFQFSDGVPYTQREPIVAYVGYLALSRGLKEMTEAIHLVGAQCHAKLVCAGGMIGGTKADVDESDPYVVHLGTVNRAQVGALLARSRVGLVVYHPTANYLHGQPTKLLEYMAAGLPVVASDFPFYRRVIKGSDCGLLVDPLKPAEIAEALLWLLQNPDKAGQMGKNGQKAIVERYNWEQEARTLIQTYADL